MRRMLRRHEVTSLSPERSGQLNFTPEQVDRLSKQLVGRPVLPQDANYAMDRTTFMNAFQHFPQIIVYCQGFSDVVQSIKFAHEVGLKPVCRCGGHSTAGYSVNDDMVIDVSGINYVRVDPDARIAWVGSGANWAQIYASLDLYGLHLPGGGCETVCAAGYMQGGGYSFTSLMFGMNCDQVVGFQMALADGRIVKANASENADLFWAVRGGTGNNFGVLLEIEYTLRELGALWGFGFKWPIESAEQAAAAAEALHVWQSHFTGESVPPNLGNQALLGHTSGPDQKMKPYFLIRGMFDGSEAGCRKALQPLLRLMPNVEQYRDIWQSGTYTELNEYLLTYPTEIPHNVPNSARSLAKSHIVGRILTIEECWNIIELYLKSPNADNFIGFEAYGGAVNAFAPNANAFWHRTASMDAFLFSFWLHESSRRAAEHYVSEFDRVLQPLSNGCSYQNYPNRQIEDFGRAYFGGNLARLLEVKKAYDPGNFFTFPQGLGMVAFQGHVAAGQAH
jgi:FAD/FMN-containing dehydrogenase